MNKAQREMLEKELKELKKKSRYSTITFIITILLIILSLLSFFPLALFFIVVVLIELGYVNPKINEKIKDIEFKLAGEKK